MVIFHCSHPNIMDSMFCFPEFVPAWKNQFIPSIHFWDSVNVRGLWPGLPHSILIIHTHERFDQLLVFLNLQQLARYQFFPSVHSSNTLNFRVPSPNWPQPKPAHSPNQSPFNMWEFEPACRKSVKSICLFLWYNQF